LLFTHALHLNYQLPNGPVKAGPSASHSFPLICWVPTQASTVLILDDPVCYHCCLQTTLAHTMCLLLCIGLRTTLMGYSTCPLQHSRSIVFYLDYPLDCYCCSWPGCSLSSTEADAWSPHCPIHSLWQCIRREQQTGPLTPPQYSMIGPTRLQDIRISMETSVIPATLNIGNRAHTAL